MTLESNMTTAQAAQYAGFAESTFEKYRVYGTGPRYLKLGKKSVRYRKADLDAWLESQIVSSTSDYRKGVQ